MEMENCGGTREAASSNSNSDPNEPSDTSVWANLSNCLLEQILLRLPPHSLVRFRAVCRGWNQLLRSKNFLERHGIVCNSQEPWILYLFQGSHVGSVYDSARKSWCKIDFQTMDNSSWCEGLFTDGGLICYNNTVLNPLTGSTRHLSRPSSSSQLTSSSQLKLCAFKVDRTTSVYRVFLLAKHRMSRPWQSYDCLLIYDSKEDSWRRTQNSPISLELEDQGMVVNDCVHFITYLYPEDDPCILRDMHERRDPYHVHFWYDLSKDEWSFYVITPHGRCFQNLLVLHHCQNRTYMISFDSWASTLRVDEEDEVMIENAQCQPLVTMCKGDFEKVVGTDLSRFTLQCVCACENLVIGFITGVAKFKVGCSSYPELSYVVSYNLHTQEWSSAGPFSHTWGHMTAVFEPRLSITA